MGLLNIRRLGGVARERLDRDLAVDPGEAPELLGDHRRLECALGGQGRVLPVTAAAAARAGVRARRADPVG